MAFIEVNASDMARVQIVLSALRKGKWADLEGTEILAFGQGVTWAADIHGRIKAALESLPPSAPDSAPAPPVVYDAEVVNDPKPLPLLVKKKRGR